MASMQNGGGYKVVGSLCAEDKKGVGNQYVDQGKVVMEPYGEKDTFAVSQENHMDIATNVAPPLKRRDYKAPNAICYKEPTIYDMKQHHAPSKSDTVQLTTGNCKGVRGDTPLVMDVVSWKERDRMAQIRNNLTDPITATDYKGPSFVGYMEKDNEALCVQMANTSSNGSNINHDVSATLAKNNTLAVAYKDEK